MMIEINDEHGNRISVGACPACGSRSIARMDSSIDADGYAKIAMECPCGHKQFATSRPDTLPPTKEATL
jgi:DNA-directed RNA polymerase subunit RPC12/RpoP